MLHFKIYTLFTIEDVVHIYIGLKGSYRLFFEGPFFHSLVFVFAFLLSFGWSGWLFETVAFKDTVHILFGLLSKGSGKILIWLLC